MWIWLSCSTRWRNGRGCSISLETVVSFFLVIACALAITVRPRIYICEASAWGSLPHDLRSIAYYQTGAYLEALEEVQKAIALEPGNERLQGNLQMMERAAEAARRDARSDQADLAV